MKINVIGTGCTWFERNNTSFLIDDKIVLDAPNGNYKYIIKSADFNKISSVLISHFHTDHFGDFHIFATKFMREAKEKKKIYGPKGLLERLIIINKASDAACDEISEEKLRQNMDFIDLYDGFEFNLEDYKVIAYKMQHSFCDVYGFVFENKNGIKIGFSADTQMCENLHKMLKNSDYAFVEMASTEKRPNHLSIEEFESLIKQYPNCKIYPVHTCDKCQEYAEKHNLNYLKDGQILEF